MLNRSDRRQSGDTLIEVLVAIAVLGAIITIAYGVMNQGFATAQNSLDRTNAQNVMNGQAALLRAAHKRASNGNPAYWNAIVSRLQSGAQVADGCASGARANLFFLNPDTAYNPAAPATSGPLAPQLYPTTVPLVRQGTVARPGDGMWIELYREGAAADGYTYTFYIKSCWDATFGDGSSVQRQAKTIVRLYEP